MSNTARSEGDKTAVLSAHASLLEYSAFTKQGLVLYHLSWRSGLPRLLLLLQPREAATSQVCPDLNHV
jgi:hypothetical protein